MTNTPTKTMRERMMLGLLDALTDDDPPVMISMGEHSLRIEWVPTTGEDQ